MKTQASTTNAGVGAAPPHPPEAAAGAFTLPELPYDDHALEPVISADTVRLHHGKHQKGYVDNLNRLVVDTPFADLSLEQIIQSTGGKPEHLELFENAAQAWNHALYWHSLPRG